MNDLLLLLLLLLLEASACIISSKYIDIIKDNLKKILQTGDD